MVGGMHSRRCAWQGMCVARETATAVDETHPTGMVCKISLSFRFRISLSDMTNYKSAYHAVKYAELRIGILLKICRFVIRHITTWYGMPN